MAQVAFTLAQAKTGFQRAHKAALAAELLCRPIFERWKAEMLAAGSGEPEEVRAAMAWRMAIALEVPPDRKLWPDSIAGFARSA